LHWVGIGFSVGGALFHAANMTFLGFFGFLPGIFPTIAFITWMTCIAILVACLAVHDRKGLAMIKTSTPGVAWLPVLLLIWLALTWGLLTVAFFGPSIVLSCAVGHWFIAHERREDASMGRKRAVMTIIAAFLASSPVLVDRLFFRQMFGSGCTITRVVNRPASTAVIAAVEGFNASAGYNWSAIPAGDEWSTPTSAGFTSSP